MNDETKSLESLFHFSDDEVKHGTHMRENSEILRGDPGESLLYAIMCAIYEGYDTKPKLYEHLDSMFAFRLGRMTISPVDIDESLQHGLFENLLEYRDTKYALTSEGIKLLRLSRLQIIYEGLWIKRFLKERNVVVTSACTLVFLVILKLWIGFMIGSNALVTDGLENLTDLVVVGIIAYSLRTCKDRLGATAIMAFMLLSGSILGINAVLGLLAEEAVEVNFWAYIVALISIASNYMLIWYKTTVGRMTGNLSLVSDAKEDGTHIRIASGVIIGLIFAEFGMYIVDSLVALFIALMIIWEGIQALRELIDAGDEISVDTIHLAASTRYDDKITDWVLAQLARGPQSLSELNDAFLHGVRLGVKYFDIHAIIGFSHLEERGISKHVQIAKRSGFIKGMTEELMITDRGLSLYYHNRASELKKVAKQFSKLHSRWHHTAAGIMVWIFVFLLIGFGEMFYIMMTDFARYVVDLIIQGLAG